MPTPTSIEPSKPKLEDLAVNRPGDPDLPNEILHDIVQALKAVKSEDWSSCCHRCGSTPVDEPGRCRHGNSEPCDYTSGGLRDVKVFSLLSKHLREVALRTLFEHVSVGHQDKPIMNVVRAERRVKRMMAPMVTLSSGKKLKIGEHVRCFTFSLKFPRTEPATSTLTGSLASLLTRLPKLERIVAEIREYDAHDTFNTFVAKNPGLTGSITTMTLISGTQVVKKTKKHTRPFRSSFEEVFGKRTLSNVKEVEIGPSCEFILKYCPNAEIVAMTRYGEYDIPRNKRRIDTVLDAIPSMKALKEFELSATWSCNLLSKFIEIFQGVPQVTSLGIRGTFFLSGHTDTPRFLNARMLQAIGQLSHVEQLVLPDMLQLNVHYFRPVQVNEIPENYPAALIFNRGTTFKNAGSDMEYDLQDGEDDDDEFEQLRRQFHDEAYQYLASTIRDQALPNLQKIWIEHNPVLRAFDDVVRDVLIRIAEPHEKHAVKRGVLRSRVRRSVLPLDEKITTKRLAQQHPEKRLPGEVQLSFAY